MQIRNIELRQIVGKPLLAIGFLLALAASASGQSDSKSYSVSIAGFPVGTAQYDASLGGGKYQVQGFMGSTGLFGWFLASRYSGAVIGRVRGDRLQPQTFRGRFEQNRKFAEVDVRYTGNRPMSVTRNPNRPRLSYEVDPATVRNALDPISALYALLRDVPAKAVCSQDFRIFDGTRTSRIRLQRASTEDGSVVCNGSYTRVGGFTKSQMAERKTFPFRLDYVQLESGDFEVREFVATTFWGVARAVLRER